ncbi:MAG: 50S ribosomal protein L11 methyltransferase, partial [Dehalococcoidia bacterium]|nr:50S ribosomal protein L11 methyltransferase [Dehalococcoidia bacterium]
MRSDAPFVFHESCPYHPHHKRGTGRGRGHRGPLRERTIVLPRTGQTFRIVQPADIDRLLDLAANDPEENLPYWAELWPSGIALADAVLLDPRRVHDTPVIELGCGLGLTAAAALQAGARLLATDYDPAALLLTRWNCRCNVGHEPMVMQLNWRRPSAEFFALVGSTGVPLVLAADVLYEQRDIEPLLSLIDRILA